MARSDRPLSRQQGAATTSITVYVHGWYAQGTYFADDLSLTGAAGAGGGGGTTTVPPAPTGLAVTAKTSSSVSLSWTAPTGTVTGYNVYENGAKVSSAATTSAGGTTPPPPPLPEASPSLPTST